MNIAYCEMWWIGRNKPINPISTEEARIRHETRQPYTALIGIEPQPQFVVKLAGDSVSVIFTDHLFRQYLRYDFKKTESGLLFLNSANYWAYDADSDSEVSSKLYAFSEDGTIFIVDHNAITGEVREFEATTSTAENWEPYPNFGDYASLCKENRTV